MDAVVYFAYGSNLLRERLLARCPNAILVGKASLPGSCVTFGKLSADGSGKAALEPDEDGLACGVLWTVPFLELPALDRLEGNSRGYERVQIRATGADGISVDAMTYFATRLLPGLKPYDWYVALVVAGAMQQELPHDYIHRLESTSSMPDPNRQRRTRRDALDALSRSGFQEMVDVLES